MTPTPSEHIEDPFSAAADPCPPARRIPFAGNAVAHAQSGGPAGDCLCRQLSRRQLLAGAAVLPALVLLGPLPAQAAALRVPCVQPEQKLQPCRHRFCRHYGGTDDIHGR